MKNFLQQLQEKMKRSDVTKSFLLKHGYTENQIKVAFKHNILTHAHSEVTRQLYPEISGFYKINL